MNPQMIDFATIIGLLLISGIITCQAFCGRAQVQPWKSRLQPPMPARSVQVETVLFHPLRTQRRDVSLAFFNRDKKKAKSIEDDVVIEDTFPPDVEHSHPSVDQDAKWMEQEAAAEMLSVFAVFVLLVLVDVGFQIIKSR